MATTFLQIRQNVARNVIDLPTAVQNSIPALVNDAMKRLQSDHNYKVMEALFEPNTTINQRILGAVPANFKEYRGMPWFLKNDGSVERMIQANTREDIWKAMDEADTNFPMIIFQAVENDIQGTGDFWVYPLPDGNSDYTDGEYRVKVPYWMYLPDLVADGDTNWFTNNAALFLEYRATARAFSIDWDTQNQGKFETMAAVEKKNTEKSDKLLRLSTGSSTLVPLWQGVNSPKLNW